MDCVNNYKYHSIAIDNMDQEPLFVNEYKVGKGDIASAIQLNIKTCWMFRVVSIVVGLSVLFTFHLSQINTPVFGIFLCIFIFLFLWVISFIPLRRRAKFNEYELRIRNIYFNDPVIQRLYFYEDHFISTLPGYRFNYDQITKLKKHPNGYMIYVLGVPQSFVRKDSFSKGDLKQWLEYILSKTNNIKVTKYHHFFGQRSRDSIIMIVALLWMMAGDVFYTNLRAYINLPEPCYYKDLGVYHFRPIGIVLNEHPIFENSFFNIFPHSHKVYAVDYVDMEDKGYNILYETGLFKSNAQKLYSHGYASYRVLSFNEGRNFKIIDFNLTVDGYIDNQKDHYLRFVWNSSGFLIISNLTVMGFFVSRYRKFKVDKDLKAYYYYM